MINLQRIEFEIINVRYIDILLLEDKRIQWVEVNLLVNKPCKG